MNKISFTVMMTLVLIGLFAVQSELNKDYYPGYNLPYNNGYHGYNGYTGYHGNYGRNKGWNNGPWGGPYGIKGYIYNY
ncbi:uncharacterized protein [Mytilus edulis]|uniref:uncharacterized protein n=1 Tax=Mytilus edulis TaxID=6550 RepID=UPI0039EE1F45